MKYKQFKTCPDAKRVCYERSDGHCEDCGLRLEEDMFHYHHITYIRAGEELPDDILVLCVSCHDNRHPKNTKKRKPSKNQNKLDYQKWLNDRESERVSDLF
jgi:5-methylcytosine-specific restriction endonuclease McrA